MKRGIVLIAILALLGVGCWYGWHALFKQVSNERRTGYEGEARYNPLYKLELTLKALGSKADSQAVIDLDKLTDHHNQTHGAEQVEDHSDVLVFTSDLNLLTPGQSIQLSSLIQNGLHAVIEMPSDVKRNPKLLDHLGVELRRVDNGECDTAPGIEAMLNWQLNCDSRRIFWQDAAPVTEVHYQDVKMADRRIAPSEIGANDTGSYSIAVEADDEESKSGDSERADAESDALTDLAKASDPDSQYRDVENESGSELDSDFEDVAPFEGDSTDGSNTESGTDEADEATTGDPTDAEPTEEDTYTIHALHTYPKDLQHGARYAHLQIGSGSVWIVPNLSMLTNYELHEPASREFASRILMKLPPKAHYHLVYAADYPSLWRLIWQHGRAVVIALGATLLIWLLSRFNALGPLRATREAPRRALLEHVKAGGEFLFRRGRAMVLYRVARDWFMARLRDRQPELAALTPNEQINALAKMTAIPVSEIAQALMPQDLGHPKRFFTAISTLARLRQSL